MNVMSLSFLHTAMRLYISASQFIVEFPYIHDIYQIQLISFVRLESIIPQYHGEWRVNESNDH